ncbi:MAG: GNAT family N-acetyltransferase [Polyangiales bacterium]
MPPSPVRAKRLTLADRAQARALFTLMTDVFEEPPRPLSDAYLEQLLGREDFWAYAALDPDGALVGGITAHVLPMTRSEQRELFIYDLAVREDRQRQGIGRCLIAAVSDDAAAQGIGVMFVPADNDDDHALAFYRAVGGAAQPVTLFVFERESTRR